MHPSMSYFICATPRSGSTLLATALWQTGVAGKPTEYFNPGWRDEIICSRNLKVSSESEYLPAVIRASTTPNGVFGTKLHAFQTRMLLSKVAWHQGKQQTSLHAALKSEFPNRKYVLVSRADVIAQAISYYRAVMSNEWRRWQGEAAPANVPLEFDHFGIEKCRALVEASNYYWERFFTEHGIEPLVIRFEELTQDHEAAVRKVLTFLELPNTIAIAAPMTARIPNDKAGEWRKQVEALGRLYTPEDAIRIAKGWAPL